MENTHKTFYFKIASAFFSKRLAIIIQCHKNVVRAQEKSIFLSIINYAFVVTLVLAIQELDMITYELFKEVK